MTEHLFKVANAFQSAIEDGVLGSSINVRRLVRNLSDFSKHMEEAITQGTADEAHIRQRAVLAALVSCPRVREEVAEQPALAPLLKTVPMLQDCSLSMVVRPLSCQSAVLPVLVHLPLHLLTYLIKMELEQITKAVSPPMLSFVVELIKALLHMLRSTECTDEVEEVLGLFVPVFRVAMQNFESNVSKNAAFTFLLLLESLYQFSRFLIIDTQDKLPISHVPELQNSFPKTETKNVKNDNSSVMETTIMLLKICHESVQKIDVNTWMSWAEIEPTDAVYCSRISRADPQAQLSVQSLITYRAFSFLNLFNSEDMDVVVNESSSIMDDAKKNLHSNLFQHSELHGFLKQIASDPDYDPDSELGFPEVVSFLQSMTSDKDTSDSFIHKNDQSSALTQKSLQKLTKKLLQESNPDLLFSCLDAAHVVSSLAASLSEQWAGLLLQRFMNHATGNNTPMAWNEAVLAVCKPVPGAEVRRAVLAELRRAGGDGCCRDWLTTASYYPNLTSLCNTMADDQETSDHSLLAEGGLWWVSVQRPRATVSSLVQQAVSVSGMALVTARAVRQLAPLCTSRYANGKLSILSEALEPFLTNVEAFTKPKQRIAFVEFFGGLCEGHYSASAGREEEPVLVEEVLRELLLPTLQWRGPADLDSLEVPLALMQVLLQHRRGEVVRCCRPGADIAALVLALLSITHNCHCLLAAQTPSGLRAPTNNTDQPVNGELVQPNDLGTRSSVHGECASPKSTDLDQERSILSSTACLEPSDSVRSNSPVPAPDSSSGPGSSQCLELLVRSREVLRRVVEEISNADQHSQSVVLLRRYLNKSCLPLPVSCLGVLLPLLEDPAQAARSEPSTSKAASHAALCTVTPMDEVCSSRAVTVMKLMSIASISVSDDREEAKDAASLLQEAREWPYEQMVIVLVQVLNSAPQEDWVAASNVLERMDCKWPGLSVAPVASLAVLRDVLQVMCCAAEAGLALNSALCYKHCTAAATHVVKQRCGSASWRERLSLVTRVFLWWCTDHVTALDADLPCLLLLRLADMVREVAAVLGTTDQKRNTPSDTNARIARRKSSIDRNDSKYVRGLAVSNEELIEQHSDAGCNGTTDVMKGVGEVVGKNSLKNKSHNTVPLIEFRAMVGSLVEPFLKHSSGGTLSQTIATRLVTLLE